MIEINGAKNSQGQEVNIQIPSEINQIINGHGLIAMPGLIDPHVHFRIPGQAHKEDWETGARAALSAGYTAVADMPNNIPACVSLERLLKKEEIINDYLNNSKPALALNYFLYLGADRKNFDQISLVKNYKNLKNRVVGIKVFMGSSTGELLMEDNSSLHAIFALAKFHDFLIAVHAEDDLLIKERSNLYPNTCCFSDHSKIRSPEVAASAVKLALNLAQEYGVRLYILHVSTKLELDLIQEAKNKGVDVFAEACPHHLFLNHKDYENFGADKGGLFKMNPPLRSPEDQEYLLEAVKSGLIDTLGSDHAPHTLQEKSLKQDQPISECPSGVPGIETNLPLLLNAVNQNILNLSHVENLCVHGPRRLFKLKEESHDWVLIDLNKEKVVNGEDFYTKCHWSPFSGKILKGWPVMTICQGRIYESIKSC